MIVTAVIEVCASILSCFTQAPLPHPTNQE